jgi:hypothetical protein
VWLGDQRLGETRAGRAIVADNVPAGSHRLRARKAGYGTWERDVQVAANQRAEIVIDIDALRPEADPRAITQPPMPIVGERWEYLEKTSSVRGTVDNLFLREVVAVARDGFRVKTEMRRGGGINAGTITETYNRDWNLLARELSGARGARTQLYSPFIPDRLYPLYPGKQWQERYTLTMTPGGQQEHQLQAHAIGWERITVPAGTFDALKVEYRDQPLGQYRMTWYVAEVKSPVRVDVTRGNDAASVTLLLVKYRRP